MTHVVFGTPPVPPPDGPVAAVVVRGSDGLADPVGVAVRADVLAAVGGPEPVRAGALADLVARIEKAGHPVEVRPGAGFTRRITPAVLHREGSGRFWLFRRHPERFPLPRPGEVGRLRFPWLVLGALHANGDPARLAKPVPAKAGGREY